MDGFTLSRKSEATGSNIPVGSANAPLTYAGTCTSKCFLSKDAYFCFDAGSCIILDARSDRYLTFTDAQSASLRRNVVGWPDLRDDFKSLNAIAGEREEKFIEGLLATGLLTRDECKGKPVIQVDITRPQVALAGEELDNCTRFSLKDLAIFIWAMSSARALKRRPFLSVVELLRLRKEKSRRQSDATDAGVKRAKQIVEAFFDLRPLLLAGPDQCWLDSLALLQWLSIHKIYPELVFGVRTRPMFYSHCWVQEDRIFYGSPLELEAIDGLTSILVI